MTACKILAELPQEAHRCASQRRDIMLWEYLSFTEITTALQSCGSQTWDSHSISSNQLGSLAEWDKYAVSRLTQLQRVVYFWSESFSLISFFFLMGGLLRFHSSPLKHTPPSWNLEAPTPRYLGLGLSPRHIRSAFLVHIHGGQNKRRLHAWGAGSQMLMLDYTTAKPSDGIFRKPWDTTHFSQEQEL